MRRPNGWGLNLGKHKLMKNIRNFEWFEGKSYISTKPINQIQNLFLNYCNVYKRLIEQIDRWVAKS